MPRGVYQRASQKSEGPQVFPASIETEKLLLCSVLNSGPQAEQILIELEPEDFYGTRHSEAYKAARALFEEGAALSPVSVHERSNVPLDVLQELSAIGPATEKEILTGIGELRRVSALRLIYQTIQTARAQVSKNGSVEEILQTIEQGIFQSDRSGVEAKDAADVLGSVLRDFIERSKGHGPKEISTGLKSLDNLIIGLRGGKVVIIAGRPSMGKTALADTLRRSVNAQGYGAITFSLEMEPEELMERELAFQSQLNLKKILTGQGVSDDDVQRVGSLAGTVLPGRWYVDSRSYTIGAIRRRARILSQRMARQGIKLGLVILDYIQLAGDNGDGREQSVAAISRGCKLMAKELGCTVLALSQLNRACESREDRRPQMSDLRESGSIEQDADIVGFVYREHLYDHAVSPSEAEFIVRKHRSGPVGTVRLHYNEKVTAFADTKPETGRAVTVIPDPQIPLGKGMSDGLGNSPTGTGVIDGLDNPFEAGLDTRQVSLGQSKTSQGGGDSVPTL